MRVNLKALGLALVAALAMSAVVASAAQAVNAKFTAPAYPTVTKGNQYGTVNYFEATPGEKIECTKAEYQATLGEAKNTLTVTPHYSECAGRVIHLNGCHFDFETAGTTNGAGETPGTADVICPKGTTITITGNFGICEIHVQGSADGKNQNLKGITFTNTANGDVTVNVDITKQIHYTDTDTAFCPFTANTTGTEGSFVSKVLMAGFVDEGSEPHPTTNTGSHPTVTYKTGAVRDIHVK